MKKLTARALVVGALLVIAIAAAGASARSDRTTFANYHLDNLDSLGGTSSVGFSINDRGWVAGRSNLPGNQSRHATLWRNGTLTDLNTLGGPNSAVVWPVKNVRGIVSGIAQTNEPDPYNEKWSCGFFFPSATGRGKRCRALRARIGVMAARRASGGRFHHRSAPTSGATGSCRCSRRDGGTRSSRSGAGRVCCCRATPMARRSSTWSV